MVSERIFLYFCSMISEKQPTRCYWCNLRNPLYVAYHDHEWGVPVHDDRLLFEGLVLEGFVAGLSWECILNKREAFRRAFDGFGCTTVAAYDNEKIDALCHDAAIVRNRQKIAAAVHNAQIFIKIQQEFGSFDRYIWHFSNFQTIVECGITSSPLSDAISVDLRRRGMKFVGTTTIYAFLQAIGIIWAHEKECFCAKFEN